MECDRKSDDTRSDHRTARPSCGHLPVAFHRLRQ
jgi:hypothetical protein